LYTERAALVGRLQKPWPQHNGRTDLRTDLALGPSQARTILVLNRGNPEVFRGVWWSLSSSNS
jgi:hypothetical protein